MSFRGLAAVLAACALALSGCASEPARLHFGMDDAPEGKRVLFPPEPEVPRFAYAGQLTGEANFRREESEAGTNLWHWITGLVAGEALPAVLQRPQAGAVDGRGRIFVSDVSRSAVFVFDPTAGELLIWEQAEGLKRFSAPIGIAPGPDGQVFVADADLGFVARLDAKGNPLPALGKGLLNRPTGVAYDAARRQLYVADTYAHDIKVLDADGRLERTIGARGEGSGRFNYPTHLALWRDELYVSDTMNARVVVLDSQSGDVLREIGSRGLTVGNLVRPKGVALDSEGNVYVVESYYDHLLVFNHRGEFLLPIGGVGMDTGKFYLPAGVWVDPHDRVFVADMFNGRVMAFQFLGSEAENPE
jgi:DNA-binding beta-propeller fold protein YncE